MGKTSRAVASCSLAERQNLLNDEGSLVWQASTETSLCAGEKFAKKQCVVADESFFVQRPTGRAPVLRAWLEVRALLGGRKVSWPALYQSDILKLRARKVSLFVSCTY